MKLINEYKTIQLAIQAKDIETIEKTLLNSDALNSIIKEYCQNNQIDELIQLSQAFRSKGLIKTIESLANRYAYLIHKPQLSAKQNTIVLTHTINQKKNEKKRSTTAA